ncbi:MAG: Phosphate ABC transporter, permease protein (PstC) [Archaeoglobus fulgidus]|uniref:Phosphate transport system permease protein n=1 Tax=Archaeoglobus fulgidus TaxID=2234 RepID=A0A117KLS8_ARCFL|nr:phosphate ABC transporter permease subunit PstC [Archaeoglobus fulgidus]KUJ93163.1 MAG: Phosphate ABC transporter, permease protein (PstC) [Archaeoglobus fulgidus]KUK05472.1 MAG: Phosphate ABC transporter, permease protein (PstC) [Archaeoglobus fulgidus]
MAKASDKIVYVLLLFSALITVAVTFGIVLTLVGDTIRFFTHISPLEFFLGTKWTPTIRPYSFGVLPLVAGTVMVTVGAAAIAIPSGLLAAVYLSEYAGERRRAVLKPLLEILAGIPTVVYGYFAFAYITPFLKALFPDISAYNALSASIVVGIMIIPIVASISEDALRAVPQSLREAGYALGARKAKVIASIVIPAALSGIVASFILGISRAIGETMAVTIAAGRTPRLVNILNPVDWLGSIETMTAAMVEIGISDVSGQSVAYQSLFAIGFTLFLMTMLLNTVSYAIKMRFREVYR